MSNNQKALLCTILFFLTVGTIIYYKPFVFLFLLFLFAIFALVITVYNFILMIIDEW